MSRFFSLVGDVSLPPNLPWLQDLGLESPLVVIGAGVGLAILAAALLFLVRRGKKVRKAAQPSVPEIHLPSLAANAPPSVPADAPSLSCYHVPMRLALVVLARRGRSAALETGGSVGALVDHLVPGLGKTFEGHAAQFQLWPAQMSAEGFTHAFFHAAGLPGEHGKGSPWAALAGPIEVNGQHMLVGLVLHADKPVNVGQVTVPNEHAWRDILDIRPNE